jgi:hypothetical protein
MVLPGFAAVAAAVVSVVASATLLASFPAAASQSADIGQPPDNWPNDYPYDQPPIKREWPDGPNKSFLQNLQRPDNHKHPYRDKNSLTCCDAGDTVETKFKVEPVVGPSTEDRQYPEDRWYAWINGQWVLVPPDKIVPDHAPDSRAYLFMLAGTIQCFVRPKGGL